MEDANVEESKQILIAVTRLQSDMSNMVNTMDDIKKIGSLVYENDQRVKSAHNRLDDQKADFDHKLKVQKDHLLEKLDDNKEDFKELKGHITWLWRAVGGGVITFGFWVLSFFMGR